MLATLKPIAGYIYPPRAVTAIPRDQTGLYRRLGYLAQLKYNDTHILLDYHGRATCTLPDVYDRHAGRPAYDFTRSPLAGDLHDLGDILRALPGGERGMSPRTLADGERGVSPRTLLDGGLLHSKHRAIKDMVVIWDVLVRPTPEHPEGEHLLGSTVQERYGWLRALMPPDPPEFEFQGESLGYLLLPRVIVPRFLPASEWDGAWATVERVNKSPSNVSGQPLLEGLVFKNPRGILKQGLKERNNADWLGRSRVTTGRHLF